MQVLLSNTSRCAIAALALGAAVLSVASSTSEDELRASASLRSPDPMQHASSDLIDSPSSAQRTLLNPGALALLWLAYSALSHRPEAEFFWHLLTRY